MSMEAAACEDLKAFERRLTEVIAGLHPSTLRWRILLFVTMIFTFGAGYIWIYDPRTSVVPLIESLYNHPIFITGLFVLLVEFALGVHKLVIAPHIITSRTRSVLGDYNMSCDDYGKLILKPRPIQQQQQHHQLPNH